jgi:hypothetical protein
MPLNTDIDPIIPTTYTDCKKEMRVSQKLLSTGPGHTGRFGASKVHDPTADIDEDWTIRYRHAYPSAD